MAENPNSFYTPPQFLNSTNDVDINESADSVFVENPEECDEDYRSAKSRRSMSVGNLDLLCDYRCKDTETNNNTQDSGVENGEYPKTTKKWSKKSNSVSSFNGDGTAPTQIFSREGIPENHQLELHIKSALKEVRNIRLTQPKTPTFLRRCVKVPVIHPEKSLEKPDFKPQRTIPVPFSFEERNKMLQKKKDEFIRKMTEEENKVKEFRARPVPKTILRVGKSSSSSNLYSSNFPKIPKTTKSQENLVTLFKARPPTVLYKKPFEPKKEKHFIEIKEFNLNTERRAKEREEFENLLREKEARNLLAKQKEEELRLRKEQEEIALRRKETEFKAQSVRKYKEVKIQPTGKVTEPKSPDFHKNRIMSKINKDNLG